MYTQPDKTQIWKRSATLTIVTVVAVTVLVGLLSSSSRSKEANLSLATKTNLARRDDQPLTGASKSAVSDIKNGITANALTTWNFVVMLNDSTGWCTGALVSATKVVTAGHCCDAKMSDFKNIRALHANVEHPSVWSDYDEYKITTQHRITKPAYEWEKDKEVEDKKQYSPRNDLCVVTLQSPGIHLERYPTLYQDIEDETNLAIAGFGMSSSECAADLVLREATVPKTACTDSVFTKKENYVGLLADASENKLICVDPDAQGRSPCCGDSGGPLMSTDLRNLYGILSDGYWRPCSGGAAWYTNLAFKDFKAFIDEQMK